MPQYRGQIYFLTLQCWEDVSFQKNSASFDLDDNARRKDFTTWAVRWTYSSRNVWIHYDATSTHKLAYSSHSVADVFLSTPVRQGVDLYPLSTRNVNLNSWFYHSLIRITRKLNWIPIPTNPTNRYEKTREVPDASEFSTYSRTARFHVCESVEMEDLIRASRFVSPCPTRRDRDECHTPQDLSQTPMSLWVYRMLIDLKRCRKRADKFKFKGYGLGLGFRLIAEAEDLSLNTKAVTRSSLTNNVLFLDFRGTIAPYSLNGRRSDAESDTEKRLVLPSVQMRRNLAHSRAILERMFSFCQVLRLNSGRSIFGVYGCQFRCGARILLSSRNSNERCIHTHVLDW